MRFAVLVSGNGTNLQALLDAEADRRLAPAEIAVVVANRPGIRALERAHASGKPAIVVDHKAYASREDFEDALLSVLGTHDVLGIVLAGFMRVLTPRFLNEYPDRVVNLHPALLPAFPGLHAQAQAVDYGVKLAGCTVHLVNAGVDEGPIILQAAVAVEDDDDADRLSARIRAKEHELLPRAVKLLAEGRLVRTGRRVRILP